jgi:hypothetical protein
MSDIANIKQDIQLVKDNIFAVAGYLEDNLSVETKKGLDAVDPLLKGSSKKIDQDLYASLWDSFNSMKNAARELREAAHRLALLEENL